MRYPDVRAVARHVALPFILGVSPSGAAEPERTQAKTVAQLRAMCEETIARARDERSPDASRLLDAAECHDVRGDAVEAHRYYEEALKAPGLGVEARDRAAAGELSTRRRLATVDIDGWTTDMELEVSPASSQSEDRVVGTHRRFELNPGAYEISVRKGAIHQRKWAILSPGATTPLQLDRSLWRPALRLEFADDAPDDLEVSVNGSRVPRGELIHPRDPSEQSIQLTVGKPGVRAWSQRIRFVRDEVTTVLVPAFWNSSITVAPGRVNPWLWSIPITLGVAAVVSFVAYTVQHDRDGEARRDYQRNCVSDGFLMVADCRDLLVRAQVARGRAQMLPVAAGASAVLSAASVVVIYNARF